jgi:hypothetical protein
VTVFVKDGEACDNSKNIRCKSFHACRDGKCAPGKEIKLIKKKDTLEVNAEQQQIVLFLTLEH